MNPGGAVFVGIGGPQYPQVPITVGPFEPSNGYIYQYYPLKESTVTLELPTVPDNGVLELPASTDTVIPVKVMGALSTGSSTSLDTYDWLDPQWLPRSFTASNLGKLSLRLFWNDLRVDDVQAWLANGSNGKGGAYRVELWQSMVRKGATTINPEREEILHIGSGKYEIQRRIAEQTFQVVIQGQTFAELGSPPTFSEVPEVNTATVLMGQEPITLKTYANAGAPFRYQWFRDDVEVHSGPVLVIKPEDVGQRFYEYRCVVSNSDGSDSTATYRIRKPHAPALKFLDAVLAAEEGGILRLVPTVVSESGATFQWAGPALEADDGRARVMADGTLEICNAQISDSGFYECTASDVEGETKCHVPAFVVDLPTGPYALAKGLTLEVLTKLSETRFPKAGYSVSSAWRMPGGEVYKDYVPTTLSLVCQRPKPSLLGEGGVHFQVTMNMPSFYFYEGKYWQNTSPKTFRLTSSFTLETPSEAAEMPPHNVPAGQIGIPYYARAPIAESIASAATKYVITGLPRGLKASAQGIITGYPTVSGQFMLSFTALNAHGKSKPQKVPLTIAPLPAGIAGEWVVAGRRSQSSYHEISRFTILPTGAFSGKFAGTRMRGNVFILPDGAVLVERLVLFPGTNYAYFDEDLTTPRGWRKTWDKKSPVGDYTGRYNFRASSAHIAASSQLTSAQEAGFLQRLPNEQGHTTGSAVIAPSGTTTVTLIGADNVTSVSSAFLGPQGEVLHEHYDPIKRGLYTLQLKVDAQGFSISGVVAANRQCFRTRYISEFWYSPSSVGSLDWPAPLEQIYQGTRYTPPDRNNLPTGFEPSLEPNAQLWFQRNPASWSFSQVDETPHDVLLKPNGSVAFFKDASNPNSMTCKVHLPTGTFSGGIRFRLSVWETSRALPFQGVFVPESQGDLQGYGRISAKSYAEIWTSLPLTFLSILNPE